MADLITTLKYRTVLADGAMGSYIFEQTGRLSEPNHVYESLNIQNPTLIQGIHTEYLQAGAQCLTTNTFEANRTLLSAAGCQETVIDLNRAGVQLAKKAIDEYQRHQNMELPSDCRDTSQPIESNCFLLGSIGPTLTGEEPIEEATDVYSEQIEPLVAEGVDALILETFRSEIHLKAAVNAIHQLDKSLPVIAQIALTDPHINPVWSKDPTQFINAIAQLGIQILGVNCIAPWDAISFISAVKDMEVVKERSVFLSVMPNVGGFQRIGHRYMSHVNPEYIGTFARAMSENGVRLVGGCCEVHPAHIFEASQYLPKANTTKKPVFTTPVPQENAPDQNVKKTNGPFSRKIKEGQFAISVEMLPPKGISETDLGNKTELVRTLEATGIADAVDITDGSRGTASLPPSDFIRAIREQLEWNSNRKDKLELIPHFTSRDINSMGLQSKLIGYHQSRIHNVLFITGDPPKMSPTYPKSTAVFDLDSLAMVAYTHRFLNSGLDFGGQPLDISDKGRTHFTIGSGVDPSAVDSKRELDRLREKIDSGVDYIMTQPSFHNEAPNAFNQLRSKVPILVGVMVLRGMKHATRLGQIPGVTIPQIIYDRIQRYEKLEDQIKVGIEIAIEQVLWVKQEGWNGIYLMSPGSFQAAIDVLKSSFQSDLD